MIVRILSGGQTGVDRAALDVALELGIECGGYCPRGRRAEDGVIPDCYPLEEWDSEDYPSRTRANIVSADGTLILHEELLLPTSPGTRLTLRLASESGKPWRSVYIGVPSAVAYVSSWLHAHLYGKTLNIAGPRESRCPGIYDRSQDFLRAVIADLVRRSEASD